MKGFAILILFIGIILVIQAYYNNMAACPEPKTIIKYVPRSIYDEQLSDKQKLTEFYKVRFDGKSVNTDFENSETTPSPI